MTRDRTESCPHCGSSSAHGCAGSALAPTSPAPPGSPPPPAGHKIKSKHLCQKHKQENTTAGTCSL